MKSTEVMMYLPMMHDDRMLILPSKSAYEFVHPGLITHVSAARSYCNVHLNSGKPILVSKSLKQLSGLLPEQYFFRVHHSYLVNVLYISRIKIHDGDLIELKNGICIPLSQRRKEDFLSHVSGNKNKNTKTKTWFLNDFGILTDKGATQDNSFMANSIHPY